MPVAGLVLTGLGLIPPFIILIVQGAKGLAELSKVQRKQLIDLRLELRGNIEALNFSGYDRTPLARYARYALIYTVEQVASLKKLAAFKAGQKLPNIRLKRRLNTLMGHLTQLDKILAPVPVKLPPRRRRKQQGSE
jgi:hypothetical protein